MDKILFVLTNYRVAEKIIPVISELLSEYDVDVFCIGQFSQNTHWPGDEDIRYDKFKSLFVNKSIGWIPGPGIRYHGDTVKPFIIETYLEPVYKCVVFDDNRKMQDYQIPAIYNWARHNKIPMIGNSHGNQDYTMDNIAGLGVSYERLFVLGQKEKDFYIANGVPDEYILLGGIPANDALKDQTKTEKHILVITNFLGNSPHNLFPVKFDKYFVDLIGLQNMAIEQKCPIVVKIKTRLDDPNYEENKAYVLSCFDPSLCDVRVVADTSVVEELIADSKLVISFPSTLTFKSIQLNKRTIIIAGGGQIGNLYKFTIVPPEECWNAYRSSGWDPIINWERLEEVITGSSTFNSTEHYINALNKVIHEKNAQS